MNVIKLVKIGMKAQGFDGLFVAGICGCKIDDLSPGDCLTEECEAGFAHAHSVTGEWVIHKHKEMQMCDYQGHEFGSATYPDSVCIEGHLWDADSGDADGDGWCYTNGGEIPCPKCNAEAHREHYADEVPNV